MLDQGAPPQQGSRTAPASPGPLARLLRRKPVERLVAEGGQSEAGAIPVAGSSYSYAYATTGELIA